MEYIRLAYCACLIHGQSLSVTILPEYPMMKLVPLEGNENDIKRSAASPLVDIFATPEKWSREGKWGDLRHSLSERKA